MLIANVHPDHGQPLEAEDAATLGLEAAEEVERFLAYREGYAPTPLVALPSLAPALGVKAVHVKDEGHRLGLGSFKALGGSYAVIRLILEQASGELGRPIDVTELQTPEVK